MRRERKKAVVLGAGGMLGSAILQTLAPHFQVIGVSRIPHSPNDHHAWAALDILDFAQLTNFLQRERPDVIINSASHVFVNQCEVDREQTDRLHVDMTALLASEAAALDAQLIYISTDSVFDGEKLGRYLESDRTNPRNYYAQSKLRGEVAALRHQRTLILRTNIFGWRTDRHLSFGEWVLSGLQKGEKRTMFTDVTYTPISTHGLARMMGRAIELGSAGLFHAGGADYLSKYDFACLVADRLRLPRELLIPTTIEEMPIGAPRPKNTAMDCSRLVQALDFPLPSIESSIDEWLLNRPV